MAIDERKLKEWIEQERKRIGREIESCLRELRAYIEEDTDDYAQKVYAQQVCRIIIELLEQLYYLDRIEYEFLDREK